MTNFTTTIDQKSKFSASRGSVAIDVSLKMGIAREGEFLVAREMGIVPSLGIESDRLQQCVAEARAKGFRGVIGTDPFGFREDNLDFLNELPRLRQLWISGSKLASVSGLYSQPDLEYCVMAPTKRAAIDYSSFRSLHTAVTHWNPKDTGLRTSNIKELYYWRHKPQSKSFEGVAFPEGLELLELNWVNPESLQGLSPMPHLRELGIHRSRNIHDFSLLPIIAPKLRTLIIGACGRATDLEGIRSHPTLERAYINGKEIKG